jgi:hypothetical protein
VGDPEEVELDLHELGVGRLQEDVEGYAALHLLELHGVVVVGEA